MRDGATDDEWATQHVARVFAAHPGYSPAERAAVEIAERMAVDHHNIGDAGSVNGLVVDHPGSDAVAGDGRELG